MSSDLVQRAAAPAPPPVQVDGVVRLRGGDRSLTPMFMCPDLTGDVLTTIRLSRLLPGSRPVVGLRARTLDDGTPVDTSMDSMASSMVERIRALQPDGDYTLMGYSFGANVAYEVGRLLEADGHTVRVAMIDPYLSDHLLSGIAKWRYHLLSRPLAVLWWLLRSDWATRRRFGQRFVHRFMPWTGVGPPAKEGEPNTEQEDRMADAGVLLFDDYRPGRLSSPLLVVAARERFPDMCDPFPLLRKLVDPERFELVWTEGSHEDMVTEVRVHDTVALLGRWLQETSPPTA